MAPKKATANKVDIPNFEEPKTEFKLFESFYRGIGSETPEKLGEIPKPQGKPGIFEGLSFVTTGTMLYFSEDDIVDIISSHGGVKRSSISSKTDVLLRGVLNVGPSKMSKAKELNIKIIDEISLVKYILSTVGKTLDDPNEVKISEKELKVSESKLPEYIFSISDMFTEKYRPRNIDDIVGNGSVIKKCKKFFEKFDPEDKKKALFIHGSPGVGKSTIATLLAIEYGYEPILLNASDTRSKNQLDIHYKQCVNSFTLDGKKKMLIIFDEIDGMSTGDRGGLSELVKLIDSSSLPVICICNDRDSQKFDTLAKRCEEVAVNPLNLSDIATKLKQIVKLEDFKVSDDDITRIAQECKGDMRFALNNLQFLNETSSSYTGAKDQHVKSVSEALRQLIDGKQTIERMFQLHFYDSGLIPIYVSESIKVKTDGDIIANLDSYSRSLDSISIGDVFNANVMESGFSTAYPASFFQTIYPCKTCPSDSVGAGFPLFFRKGQTQKKIQRWIMELINHTRQSFSESSIFGFIENLYASLKGMNEEQLFQRVELLGLYFDDLTRLHELCTYLYPNEKKKEPKIPNLKTLSKLYKSIHSNQSNKQFDVNSRADYYVRKLPRDYKSSSNNAKGTKKAKASKLQYSDDYSDYYYEYNGQSYDGEFVDPSYKSSKKKKVLGYTSDDYE